MDTSLIGSVINALPIDKMISGPLQAMVKAQTQASKTYVDFLMSVCIKDGKAVAVEFDYDEVLTDEEGNNKGLLSRKMQVPLLAVITHPNIAIEEGTIDFELEVSQTEASSSSTEGEGSFEASLGWGPFKVTVKGRVSHKSEQTRKTDTRAKYSIHTRVARQNPPEAMSRIIDYLTDAQTKPIGKVDASGSGDKTKDPNNNAKDPKDDGGKK